MQMRYWLGAPPSSIVPEEWNSLFLVESPYYMIMQGRRHGRGVLEEELRDRSDKARGVHGEGEIRPTGWLAAGWDS